METINSFKNELEQLIDSYSGLMTNVEIIGVLHLEMASITYDSLSFTEEGEDNE